MTTGEILPDGEIGEIVGHDVWRRSDAADPLSHRRLRRAVFRKMPMRADNAAHRADCRAQKSKTEIQGCVVYFHPHCHRCWKKLKAWKPSSSSRARRANFPIRLKFWFTAPRKLKCCATRCRRAQKSRRKCAMLLWRKSRRCKCRRRRGNGERSWICDEILRRHSVFQSYRNGRRRCAIGAKILSGDCRGRWLDRAVAGIAKLRQLSAWKIIPAKARLCALAFNARLNLDSPTRSRWTRTASISPRICRNFSPPRSAQPDALIVGVRDFFAAGCPTHRRRSNAVSTFWFRVETGVRLPDTQCGFRCYPLALTQRSEAEIRALRV